MTTSDDWDSRREKIIGLGEKSHRKSYYPELKRRLEELERFRTLLDFSNDAIFLIEAPSCQIVDVNKGACDQLGYTRDQVLAHSLDQFVLVHDAELINTFLCDENALTEEGKLITTRLHTTNRGDVPVEVTVQRVMLGDQVYGVLVARDISARLEMEADLRKSEERFRILYENSPVPIWEEDFSAIKSLVDDLKEKGVTDLEQYLGEHPEMLRQCVELVRITNVNQAAMKMHQAASKEELLRGLAGAFTPESYAAFQRQLLGIWNGETALVMNGVVQTLGGDPRQVTLYWSVSPGHEQTLSKILLSIIDITEQIQAEQDLKRSNDLLRAIIEAAPTAIVGLDLDGKVQLVWNPAAEKMLGWSAHEVMGHPLPSVPVESQEEFKRFREQIRRGLILDGVEVRRQRRDGTPIDYSIYASPLHDTEGHITGNIAVLVDITERKRMEQDLIAREIEYRTLVEHIPDFVVRYNKDLRRVYVNPAWERASGLSAQEVVNIAPAEIPRTPTPTVAEYMEKLQEALKTGIPQSIEFSWVNAHGVTLYLEYVVVPEYDPRNQIAGVLAVGRDITERKRAEAELRKLSRAVEQSPASVIITDTTGSIEYVNPKFTQLTGYALDEVLGRNPRLLKSGHISPEEYKRLWASITSGQEWRGEFLNKKKNGEFYWEIASISPVRDTQGTITHFIAVKEDITTRKRAEEALRESEKQFRLLAENSTDMISLHAPDSNYLYVSPACTSLLGYEPDELIGHSAYDFVYPADAADVRRSHTTIIEQPVVYTVPYRIRRKDGTYIWFETTSRTIRDSQTGAVIEIQAASRDITARKQAEEAEQRRRRIAETLVKAAAVLNSTLDLDQVLDLILQQLRRAIDYDSASFLEIEDEHLVISACQGFRKSNQVLGTRFPIDPSLPAFRVVTDKAPLHLTDVGQEYPRFQDQKVTDPSHYIYTWLGVPVLSKERMIGMIALDRLEIRPFTNEDIELATAFANQAAITIENAQLHKQTQRHAEELEQRVEERTTDLQQEILERKRVEEALRESDARHRVIAELTSDYIYSIIVQPDGIAETGWMSGAVERITGYTAEDIRALTGGWNSLVLPDGIADFAPLWTKLLSGQTAVHEYRITTKSGEVRWLRDYKKPIWNDAEEHVALIWGAVQDITERKQVEEALRQRTAQLEAANEELRILSQVKDEFVSNVSHELRTPITNLKLRHHLLAARPDRWEGHLDVMSRETKRLEQIIESLLLLSRLDQARVDWNLKPVDLNHLASQFVRDRTVLAQSAELSLSFTGEPDLPFVEADVALWEQALSILLTNAFNYTPAGGHVEVRTQVREQEGQRWVGVSVSDTGPGISPEEQSHLFERFFRGTAGRESGTPGTGLGLSIVQEIVNKHRGRVEMFSEGTPGKGTTFSLWLLAAGSADEKRRVSE